MSWVRPSGFTERCLVIVEDHLHHVTEILAALAAAEVWLPIGLLEQTTVLCLDLPGPDTAAAVRRWLEAYPGLQVAAVAAETDLPAVLRSRWSPLDPAVFQSPSRFCTTAGGLLRAGGLLLQDIQLSTLRFLPEERWWESIVLANAVRGQLSDTPERPRRPPACCFLSNKKGYEATFGRDLLDAGFDPRDVLSKDDLGRTVVPLVRETLARAFPRILRTAGRGGRPAAVPVADHEGDRRDVEAELDLVLWAGETTIDLGGRLLATDTERPRLTLRADSQEAVTWRALVDDRLTGGPGVPVTEVGRRVAPAGAAGAELTNSAARHAHDLRKRIGDRERTALLTVEHAYRLSDRLAVGRVE
jgi:hypothetical protein